MYLLTTEGGKTIRDADAEIRESLDFCYFYNKQVEELQPSSNPSVSGESNITYYAPRGKWLTINPWNFPLAILIGQAIAPLIVGNEVTIKASNKTPKISLLVWQLMMKSELPVELTFSRDIDKSSFNGISFTGSHETAREIYKELSESEGEIIPFIAETSGLNYTIIDSSVLLEQTVKLVAESAFNSNGQRCSSSRQLLIQEDILDSFIKMLEDHMMTWRIGSGFDADYNGDKYSISDKIVEEEIFGPDLGYTSFKNSKEALDIVNSSGYGLTLGIHSRIKSFCDEISLNAKVGNIYINRDQIGAVVESQPFGGVGLSGTGPKAGGKDYIKKFVYEKTITTNLTALGGNIDLLTEMRN
jgi:RHH-type proline utilization regulon transcriptional repressor/proline dehydrogenase/delta 1-pyrroline-5-carboxylate dehydrogenase